MEAGEPDIQGHLWLDIKLRAIWAAFDSVYTIILTNCHHYHNALEQNQVYLPYI